MTSSSLIGKQQEIIKFMEPKQTYKIQKVYSYEELSEDVQFKVLERYCYIELHHNWWEFLYDDAKEIGLIITSHDDYRATGHLDLYFLDSIKAIRKNHGRSTETWQTAKHYIHEYNKKFKKWLMVQEPEESYTKSDWIDEFARSDVAEDIVSEYEKSLLEDYRILLQKEYVYLTSEAAILRNFSDGDCKFTIHGFLV
jgi:hypothetical protein